MLMRTRYKIKHSFKVYRFYQKGIARLREGLRDDSKRELLVQVGDGTSSIETFYAQQKVARKARSYGLVVIEYTKGILKVLK